MTNTPSSQSKRFEALDAWRGIAACLIVFYHFSGVVKTHFVNVSFIADAFIFVDFFFVLSGFVIAISYQDKIISGMKLKDYVLMRFGRIYPLFFFMLLCFVGLEAMKYVVPARTAPFDGYYNNFTTLFANLLLIHNFVIFDRMTWNGQSWSISAEFYTYILYAIVLLWAKTRMWIICLVVVLITPFLFLLMGKENIEISFNWGWLRCIYGFSAGVICYEIYKLILKNNLSIKRFHSFIEISALCLLLGFIHFCARNEISLLSPYIISICLLVFAFEKGIVSRILKTAPLQLIGLLSYSIYMTHTFVIVMVKHIIKIADKKFQLGIVTEVNTPYGPTDNFTLDIWYADALQIFIFIAVLIGSYLTYHLIENPANRWTRRYVQQKSHKNVPQATDAAF